MSPHRPYVETAVRGMTSPASTAVVCGVLRASGMSVWQFLRPGMVVAFALGVFGVTAYNPMAA